METFENIQRATREKRIKAILEYKEFNTLQREILNKYHLYLKRKNYRLASQKSYLQNLKMLLLRLNKNFEDLTKTDIDQYLESLNKKFKPKTIFERRKFLVVFLEWYFDKDRQHIDLLKDISLKKDKGIKLPEEMLSPKEIKKMAQVADNFRDKAIIFLLYELAARKGEFLLLKIKHIDITNKEYGFVTIPMGKTSSRKVPIVYSVPHIQNWLNSHPNRNDPEAPLFVNLGAWLDRPLGEDGLKRMLKIVAKRAKISKRVYCHLFRHSRITELAKELTEQELKIYAGWTPNSNMASVYVHLSGKDVGNKILANAGLIDVVELENGKEILKSIRCPRCSNTNPADAKYCSCGFIVDIDEVNKVMQKKESTEKNLNSFFEVEEMQDLFKTIYKMKKQIEEMQKS